MSMLAERKQKQKWTLNPRGKFWSDDNNKFGQKMLEKMGWSSGKGLGANLDGITEHIKQSYKNDAKGIGFADKGDQWTKHEVDFSSLLENLGDTPETNIKKPEVSLEKKSQSSRVRVHYHKFTRGKDLSRYSEKDLANVFGRKTLEKVTPVENKNDEIDDTTEGNKFGVTTVHGGNMAEYFKSKYKKIMKPLDSVDLDNERPAFGGLGYDSVDVKIDNITSEVVDTEKKKKKKTKVVINECFDNPGFTDFTDNIDSITEIETEPIPKKKKKKTPKEQLAFDNPTLNIDFNGEITETTTSENVSAKKKSKKEKLAFDNPGLNIDFRDETVETTEIVPEKKNKSKKRKLETIEEIQEVTEEVEEIIPKKRKKDTKEKQIENNVDSVSKKSKKSKKINIGVDNLACTELSAEVTQVGVSDSQENGINKVKKSKKRRKVKKTEGVDNMACTANSVQQNIEETITSMTNAIDNYQLELENQMNEKKVQKQVTKRKRERKPAVKDKKTLAEQFINPRKSIKDLYEQGKVRVHFEGSNINTIAGYGVPI